MVSRWSEQRWLHIFVTVSLSPLPQRVEWYAIDIVCTQRAFSQQVNEAAYDRLVSPIGFVRIAHGHSSSKCAASLGSNPCAVGSDAVMAAAAVEAAGVLLVVDLDHGAIGLEGGKDVTAAKKWGGVWVIAGT